MSADGNGNRSDSDTVELGPEDNVTRRVELTIVPLLRIAPLAHHELVTTSSAVMLLCSRFQSPPQAGWPSIWSGSFCARSKRRTRVGETTTASSATIPELPFRLNCHWEVAGADGAAEASVASKGRRGRRGRIVVALCGCLGGWVGTRQTNRGCPCGLLWAEVLVVFLSV